MVKKSTGFFTLFFIFHQVFGQLAKDYTPLESYGTIPKEFNTPIESRYTEAVKGIKKSEKRIVRRDKKDFLLESHNELDLYLKSGHVVFNDEVGKYINKVAESLLVSEGNKAAKVKFYPIKFDYANAFTFNEGVVFVNVGLIARCNNEAELAFILGHEYGHYIKHHSIDYHTELKQASRGAGSYRKKNIDDKRALMSRFSKEHEIESDIYGYNLLKKSNYDSRAAISALEGLNQAYDIPAENAFEKAVIEKGKVRIPQIYLLENKVDTLKKNKKKSEEEEEEEESEEDTSFTHPSIEDRVNEIWNVFAPKDTISKKLYLNPKSDFEYVRELCRFEMCRIYLTQNNLDNAFCLITSLLEKYPDNLYLNRMMSVTLYRIAKAVNEGNLSRYVPSYSKSSDDLKDINYLIHKFKKEEITLVALRYSWDVRVKQPTSKDALAVNEELLNMYTSRYKQNLNLFANINGWTESTVDSLYRPQVETVSVEENGGKAKKKKTVAKKTKGSYQFERSLSLYALADVKTDPAFIAAFESSVQLTKKSGKYSSGEEGDEDNEDEETPKKDKYDKAEKSSKQTAKKAKEKDDKEQVNGIILLEPDFELVDERKKVVRNYVANEETESDIRKAILECSDKADVDVKILNANDIKANEIQKMNDYCVLKEFMYEFFAKTDYKNNTMATDYNKIREIGERYHTRYLSVMINKNLIKKRKGKEYLGAIGLSVLLPYVGIPYLITRFFPDKQFVYVVGVIDMYDGKLVYGKVLEFSRRERKDLFKSQFYATLIELKGKK